MEDIDYGTYHFTGWSPSLREWIQAGLNPKTEFDLSLTLEAELEQ